MPRSVVIFLSLVLALFGAAAVAAQPRGQGAPEAAQAAANAPIPTGAVVWVYRAEVKPGQAVAQEKAAAATARVYADLPGVATFLAMKSEVGPSEVWFLVPYQSVAGIDEENDAMERIPPARMAEMRETGSREDSHYSRTSSMLLKYREDLSLGASFDVSAYRMMSVETYRVRPGRTEEFVGMGKKIVAAYKEAVPGLRFAGFEVLAGAPRGTFIFMMPMKKMAELVPGEATEKAFADAMGKEAMAQLQKESGSVIAGSEEFVFSFSPKMSALPARYAAADPFWRVTEPAAAKKPPEPPKK